MLTYCWPYVDDSQHASKCNSCNSRRWWTMNVAAIELLALFTYLFEVTMSVLNLKRLFNMLWSLKLTKILKTQFTAEIKAMGDRNIWIHCGIIIRFSCQHTNLLSTSQVSSIVNDSWLSWQNDDRLNCKSKTFWKYENVCELASRQYSFEPAATIRDCLSQLVANNSGS